MSEMLHRFSFIIERGFFFTQDSGAKVRQSGSVILHLRSVGNLLCFQLVVTICGVSLKSCSGSFLYSKEKKKNPADVV